MDLVIGMDPVVSSGTASIFSPTTIASIVGLTSASLLVLASDLFF
jgi:hypothetical protein